MYRLYLPVWLKFVLAFGFALGWLAFTSWLAAPWIHDLSDYVGMSAAVFIIAGIALIPGFMNMFLLASLMADRRPPRRGLQRYPPVSVMIAAYNEEAQIGACVHSVLQQDYPGELEVMVIDDGSHDATRRRLKAIDDPRLRVLTLERNGGKANALNAGLAQIRHEYVITIDADTYMYPRAIQYIVERMEQDPPHTVAVAGEVLVRNSREGWLSRMQEWDYFHGIAAAKRMQSLFQGTLVAQGAFSLYRTSVLRQVGGWPDRVGEDIVLTWDLLARGWRIGYAEDAVVFTFVPQRYSGFYRQRKRWSRGMLEAFKAHPRVILQWRFSSFFILWNALFPVLDTLYLFVFLPGIIAALFGYYYIAGPMTLAVLPLSLMINLFVFRIQHGMFRRRRLRVRRNYKGFVFYVLFYQFIMGPALITGYLSEFLNLKKSWN